MRVLALDTATLTASVALLEGTRTLAAGDARVSTHSEQLLPLIDAVLARAGVAAAAIDAVACGAGPGSFTGLRIGLATAKGLCFALGKPLALASSLAALALEIDAPLVLALLDAKKAEVYAGVYRKGIPAAPEVVLPPRDLPAWARRVAAGQNLVVVGDGAAVYREAAAACGEIRAARATPSAEKIARLGAAALAAGGPADLMTAAPTYLRASEAEIATPPKDL